MVSLRMTDLIRAMCMGNGPCCGACCGNCACMLACVECTGQHSIHSPILKGLIIPCGSRCSCIHHALLSRLLSSCRCCDQGQSEQAVGVALESRRLDKLEEVIGRSSDAVKAIKYSLRACQKLVINRSFRQQVQRSYLV